MRSKQGIMSCNKGSGISLRCDWFWVFVGNGCVSDRVFTRAGQAFLRLWLGILYGRAPLNWLHEWFSKSTCGVSKGDWVC